MPLPFCFNMQTVKEFLQAKNNKPQFKVLLRFTPGKTIDYHILSNGGNSKEIMGVIPGTPKGVIRVVERISDKNIFTIGDFTYNNCENIFIEFMEDMVHCGIIDTCDKQIHKVELNNIESSEMFRSREELADMGLPIDLIDRMSKEEYFEDEKI